MNWSWQLCTWRTSNVQRKCQGPLQLLSPPFLVTSTTKQMRPNGKGGVKNLNRPVSNLNPQFTELEPNMNLFFLKNSETEQTEPLSSKKPEPNTNQNLGLFLVSSVLKWYIDLVELEPELVGESGDAALGRSDVCAADVDPPVGRVGDSPRPPAHTVPRLQYDHVDALLVQQSRRRQTADTATDHHHFRLGRVRHPRLDGRAFSLTDAVTKIVFYPVLKTQAPVLVQAMYRYLGFKYRKSVLRLSTA